jgi:hypothetical protein
MRRTGRTRTPRQAYAKWIERRALVPVHDACGSPGRCYVSLAHRPRCAHVPSLADGCPYVATPFCRTPTMPRPTLQRGCLGTQGSIPHCLAPSYKSRRLLSSREHRAAAASHWHSLAVSHCSAQLQCHLSLPSPSSCTTLACTPVCKPGRAACSPESEFQWSPLSTRR